MTRRFLSVLLMMLLAYPTYHALAAAQSSPADLAQGIRQVEEGDLDAAIITLDGVVQRLKGVQGRNAERAQAHLYLGMAYQGVGQQERAKAEMLEAWRNDKGMKLDPKKFPPRVIQAYEEAKTAGAKDQASAVPVAPVPVKSPAVPAPAPTAKKGGSSKALLVVGGLALAGGAAAAAGGGGGSPAVATSSGTSTPTSTPAPTPAATATPVATCSLTMTTTPDTAADPSVGGRFCTATVVSTVGGQLGTVSGTQVFVGIPCTAGVTVTASAAPQSSIGGSLPADWSNACGGSALGRPCVMNPISTNRALVLTCSTR